MNKNKENNTSLFQSLLYLRQELLHAGFTNTANSLNQACSAFMKDIVLKGHLDKNWLSNEEFIELLDKLAPDVLEHLLEQTEVLQNENVIEFFSFNKKAH